MSYWKRKIARSVENVRLALAAIWVSRVRAFLTMLIISIGLLALMGMLTVVNAVSYTIESEIGGEQGAALEITSWAANIRINGRPVGNGEDYSYITRWQAERFCKDFSTFGNAAYETWLTSTQLKYRDKKSRPSLAVTGISDNYLLTNNETLAYGRDFSAQEIHNVADVVIIGSSLAKQLFDKESQALGKRLMVGSAPFTVVGVLSSKSSSFGGAQNENVYVPLLTGLTRFSVPDADCRVMVNPRASTTSLSSIRADAEMVMRRARGLRPIQRNTFNMLTNDELTKMILGSLASVGMAAILIGLITLVGSAIALMNIMLASVTERTREIGTRKAIGAYSSTIRGQFLLEAIFITVFGGIVGILLGIIAGRGAAGAMGVSFTIPWTWAIGSLILCIVVGVFAGYLPASRAAGLDPIDALRYE
mgnify:CR=1 FL=1